MRRIIDIYWYFLYALPDKTIINIQRRLAEKVLDINKNSQTKEGFAQSMKKLFREYDSKPFLYNVNTPDFQSFAAKLPEEMIKKIKLDSFDFQTSYSYCKLKSKNRGSTSIWNFKRTAVNNKRKRNAFRHL